jgi:hypothetical protein
LTSEFASLLDADNPVVYDRINKLKKLYDGHLNEINKACDEFCKRNLGILESQASQRPVTRSQMMKTVVSESPPAPK